MALIFNYWFADIVAISTVLLTTVYLYFQHAYSYWKRKNIHYIEPKFPFGNAAEIFTQKESIGENVEKLYFQAAEYKYAGMYQIYRPLLIVRDPDLIKNIMIKSFEHFHDHGLYFDEKSDPLSAHLFNLAGIKWRNLRAKLSPTFTSGKMKMMFETLAKCGEQLDSYLQTFDSKGEVVEVKDLLSRYSTDIIASCAFGLETNCLKNPDSEFRVWGRKIFESSIKNSIRDAITFLPTLSAILKIPFVPKDITKYFMAVVKDTIDYRENNNISRNDFMQLLIQLKNKGYVDPDRNAATEKEKANGEIPIDNKKLTFNEIAAQALVFFLAGFETSATTMTFCLYELANNTDIQTKLRKEIRSVLEKYDGKVTYDAIHEMAYLDKVISESLRMHPPVPVLLRLCDKDFIIEETGDVIEKGTQVTIPIRGLQRDEKYFPNPNSFNPENFSEEAVKGRSPFVYMPFGEGPRICIGQRFGLMQVKVGLISVLRNNEVTLSPRTSVPLKLDKRTLITSPAGGMWLNIATVK